MTNDGPISNHAVVIVGAGPAGLALAIELGSRAIPCLILERDARAGYAPRAKTTQTRTREHLRRWGIADRLAAASPFGVDYPGNVLFVTRLSGPCIIRFDHALNCSPQRDERYSEHSQWIPQYKLEKVLRDHALTLPSVTLQFGLEFLSFRQDQHTVQLRVRDTSTNSERTIETNYLVGADGSRSAVRKQIGATMIGTAGLSYNYNTIFRAPGLANAHPHGPAVMYWQINGEVPSLIGPMDRDDLWFFMPTMLPPDVSFTNEQVQSMIRRSTGIDLPYEILSSDVWVANRLLADRYSAGRVFLIGDACHLHPPFGGFGMNMGVADAVDLGWKLAAVLQDWGGATLLDSYEFERRQAHELVLNEAATNHTHLPNNLYQAGLDEMSPRGAALRQQVAELIRRTKTDEFYALGVVLGYRYENSPIVVNDAIANDWQQSRDYRPSAAPGCLAPHHWLADGRSLYDLFGSGFTLLVLGNAEGSDIESAERDASRSHVPLTIVRLPDAALAERYRATRALIRPDQHVAWRGDVWPGPGVLAVASGRGATAAPTRLGGTAPVTV